MLNPVEPLLRGTSAPRLLGRAGRAPRRPHLTGHRVAGHQAAGPASSSSIPLSASSSPLQRACFSEGEWTEGPGFWTHAFFLCMGTPDLPQRGALSLRAPGLSWVRERGLTADLGAGRRRRGNRLQNAFRPGGGGAGSPEPRSRWVCVCPELVGGGCPRRCYFHPLWLQQRAREVSGGDKRKCRGDGKSPLLAPGRERWR